MLSVLVVGFICAYSQLYMTVWAGSEFHVNSGIRRAKPLDGYNIDQGAEVVVKELFASSADHGGFRSVVCYLGGPRYKQQRTAMDLLGYCN
jgi:hypothetical protein